MPSLHRLILEGRKIRGLVNEHRLKAFLDELVKRIGTCPSVVRPVIKAYPFGAYALWSKGKAFVNCWPEHEILTLDITSREYFKPLEADALYRWYFKPEILFNCTPILSSRTQ
jgi:hypothetical protein